MAVHLAEARHRTRLLRALLGVAKVTGRVLILPRLLCYCDRPAAQLDGRWVCAELVEGDFCILGREND